MKPIVLYAVVSETAGCLTALTDPPVKRLATVVSCEHGGFRVPPRYRQLFEKTRSVLETHEGWDHGALLLAKELSRQLRAPLITSEVTRLLVDLNRSSHHCGLFSAFTKTCDNATKMRILREHYFPYREKIESLISEKSTVAKRVIHFSIHSFTPQLDDQLRTCDIGLLYDSRREAEKKFCHKLQARMKAINETLTIRRNYPYLGKADGLTTYLRQIFPEQIYLGIEIEINQKHVLPAQTKWKWLRRMVINAIEQCLYPGQAKRADPN
jgi:predicted N-formylglutamate amidohydrolase